MTPEQEAHIRARDATAELVGEPIDPPEGVVFTDSCVMRAYDRRMLLAALDEARAELDEEGRHADLHLEQRDAARADGDALAGALREMVRLAASGAARAHLDDAGIMQDPPHSGKFAECAAPWCVRNQTSLAAARHILAAHEARGS